MLNLQNSSNHPKNHKTFFLFSFHTASVMLSDVTGTLDLTIKKEVDLGKGNLPVTDANGDLQVRRLIKTPDAKMTLTPKVGDELVFESVTIFDQTYKDSDGNVQGIATVRT